MHRGLPPPERGSDSTSGAKDDRGGFGSYILHRQCARMAYGYGQGAEPVGRGLL